MGCKCAATDKASAIITRFLIMYWPVKVGTRTLAHVSVGKRISGRKVATMCGKSRIIASRSNPETRNASPIIISYKPKNMRKPLNETNGRVFLRSAATSGSAGLISKTFRSPNQKKITKSAPRAIGNAAYLICRITYASNRANCIPQSYHTAYDGQELSHALYYK